MSGDFGCHAGAAASLRLLRKCLISLKVFFPSLFNLGEVSGLYPLKPAGKRLLNLV